MFERSSRNPPAVFAASDLESIHIGVWSDCIHPIARAFGPEVDNSVDSSELESSEENSSTDGSELEGSETNSSEVVKRTREKEAAYCINLKSHLAERYGRPRVYKASRAKTQSGDRPNLADGLLVLQIQESILTFLVKLCKSMLHDKNL